MIEAVGGENGVRAVSLLEALVAIPSVTGEEAALLEFVAERCRPRGFTAEWIQVTPGRSNLFLHGGRAEVVFTTHADTVPPFVPARREGGFLHGRGACDAKGSLAAMAVATDTLAREGAAVGLLVVVGEERGSDGALAANRQPHGAARFLVGGEPTGNRFIAGCKGALRISAAARGVAGHSSQPATDQSAVPPLLDFLAKMRALGWPEDPFFGETTANIGVLSAGTAPNVIADSARAEILFRTGVPVEEVLGSVRGAALERVALTVAYRSDPALFRCPRGRGGEVVSFACDLPLMPAWGEPILVGPGSIDDAHRASEKVLLQQVEDAAALYEDLARGLLALGEEYLEPAGTFIQRSRRAP